MVPFLIYFNSFPDRRALSLFYYRLFDPLPAPDPEPEPDPDPELDVAAESSVPSSCTSLFVSGLLFTDFASFLL